MLNSIKLTVGDAFESDYPVRTGPTFETVKGYVEEIHLAAAKVTIRNRAANGCWVISLEDAFTKNKLAVIDFKLG